MELIDGWYGVRAGLDAPLTALLAAGRLQPGAGAPCAAPPGSRTGEGARGGGL
jgi:hypothetical protein